MNKESKYGIRWERIYLYLADTGYGIGLKGLQLTDISRLYFKASETMALSCPLQHFVVFLQSLEEHFL